MTFHIDSDIPVPKTKTGAGRPPKYPFDKLQTGQSFAVPCRVGEDEKVIARLRNAACGWARRAELKRKFAYAYRDTDEQGLPMDPEVRVWRTDKFK